MAVKYKKTFINNINWISFCEIEFDEIYIALTVGATDIVRVPRVQVHHQASLYWTQHRVNAVTQSKNLMSRI